MLVKQPKLFTRLLAWLHLSAMIFATLFFFSPLIAYEVEFEGVSKKETLELLKQVSQLEKLKEQPPATLAGLKQRAKSDLDHILQVFHQEARYQAKASYLLKENGKRVVISIKPGPVYPLAQYQIHYLQNGKRAEPRQAISLKDLKLQYGKPATPELILNAEDLLLDQLNLQGYAFAKILERKVFADLKSQEVKVKIEVDIGPLTYFGQLSIKGLQRVQESFIYKKIAWQEGDLYNPKKIEKTQEALDLSGLFRSVNISHAEEPVHQNLMPLSLSFIEAKQRTVGCGINYNSQLGPGVSAEWEDRNVFGKGQRLSFKTDLWSSWQYGNLRYLIPDYRQNNQNLIWQLNYDQGHLRAFTERTVALSVSIERRFNKWIHFSYGLMYKHLLSERSENNGTFNLIKAPLQLKWSNIDDILDPSQGASINFVCIPSLQFVPPTFSYCINTITTSFYRALTKDKKLIFAVKLMLGSIVGAGKRDIPPPERFYAGSQNSLRGYRFLTVSPLEKHCNDKPIGGRSMFIYTLELRKRITEEIGLVGFWDMGNVYFDAIADFERKLLHSTGVGLRYYTPIGPLRLDIAIPLDRRKKIDNYLEVYFSIGQSF